MASEDTQDLQLVPEVILKRKHDMDEMKAHRAAQQVLNPRGNLKVFNNKKKAIKVHRPETILAMARNQRNHNIRYKRVLKKGMQKRASKDQVKKTKLVIPEGVDTMEEEEREQKEISYVANSVGAKLVFIVRIREPNGMSKNVRRILNSLRLTRVSEVSYIYTRSFVLNFLFDC
mmetsp:Transcript_2190/g.2490  ORF Transcript_2190/g.2490 Transcript_2190/m.2490 type:complete len:174 (-) Transcript_2190:476-997(-)